MLQAQAIERGTQEPVEPQSEFIIQVQDINDNPPLFQEEPYVCSIPEMSPKGRGALPRVLEGGLRGWGARPGQGSWREG